MPLPFVSVIMPVRNEEAFIERSLGAMLAQDYPHDRYEVLVVDGMSTDRTREIVTRLAEQSDVPLRILDNPKQIVPCALNIGILASKGDIVIRMDGHAVASPEYLRHCVEVLRETRADNVGGVVVYEGPGGFSRAAAVVAQSRFGCGGAPARSAVEGPVDTVSFGCWPRETFQRFGLFDERFVRSQDSELNYRIRNAGGTVWLSPRIRSVYFGRSDWKGLARQYFQYGLWKNRVLRKAGWRMHWRHLVPPFFVLALLGSAASLGIGLRTGEPMWLVAGALTPAFYAVADSVNALVLARQGKLPWALAFQAIAAAAVMHVAWGTGFLLAVFSPLSSTPLIPAFEEGTRE